MHIRIIVDKPNCNQSFPLSDLGFLWLQRIEMNSRWFQQSKEALWHCPNAHLGESLARFWDREAGRPQEEIEL